MQEINQAWDDDQFFRGRVSDMYNVYRLLRRKDTHVFVENTLRKKVATT